MKQEGCWPEKAQGLSLIAELLGDREGQGAFRVLRRRQSVLRLRSADFVAQRVIADRLGDTDVLLVGAPDSGAVRAYLRDGHSFRPAAESAPDTLVDETGRLWRITEETLVPSSGTETEVWAPPPGRSATKPGKVKAPF